MDMDMTENDTTSHITTGAKNVPVFDDAGEFGGTAQVFTSVRSTEAAAEEAIRNPQSEDFSFEALVQAMLEKGMVWCQRCETFKDVTLFPKDERNPGRLYCQSFCLQCVSEQMQTKRQIWRNGVRSEGYRYQARKAKRRRRK
jgi:hypothetical protein